MDTKVTSQTRADAELPQRTRPKEGSPVRLLVLLGVLALVVGAYGYDYLVLRPDTLKADKDIQNLVDERNKKGVKDADLVRSKDIQAVVGFKPTYTEDKKDHTIEYYCWWGKTPFLSKRRNYISVVYVGDEPRRFSTHHLNSKPEEENLPLDSSKPPAVEMPGEGGEDTDKAAGSDTTDSDTPVTPAVEGTDDKASTPAPTSDDPASDKPADEKADKGAKADSGDSEGKNLSDLLKDSADKDSADKDSAEKDSTDKDSADKKENSPK